MSNPGQLLITYSDTRKQSMHDYDKDNCAALNHLIKLIMIKNNIALEKISKPEDNIADLVISFSSKDQESLDALHQATKELVKKKVGAKTIEIAS